MGLSWWRSFVQASVSVWVLGMSITKDSRIMIAFAREKTKGSAKIQKKRKTQV